MRLLIINYEMDDFSPVLAWQAEVVRRLAKSFEHVTVLTENIGTVKLPENVAVRILPKKRRSIIKIDYWVALYRLVIELCLREHPNFCFIHMAHEWTYRLYPVLKLFHIPILLWYAHGTVTSRLKLAHFFANRIVTSSPEGFRIHSRKVIVIGQGIDVERFAEIKPDKDNIDILYIGRISKRKRISLMIDAFQSLKSLEPGLAVRLQIVGPPLTQEDLAYDQEMRAKVWQEGLQDGVIFVGYVPQQFVSRYYRTAFLHLNVSKTGSMDKTILESLACGCPVLTSNEAFFETLKNYPEMLIKDEDPKAMAKQILHMYLKRGNEDQYNLKRFVLGTNDLESYISKLVINLYEISNGKV